MKITFVDTILTLAAEDWDALANPGSDPQPYPFSRHAFLAALERSGCTSAASGWQPQHLIVKDGQAIIAALPLYLKSHSYGEYVFDWAWADAYRQQGRHYYPKLVCAIPFTPAQGPRLLVTEGYRIEQLLPSIVAALEQRCQQLGASGWHCLFPNPELNGQLTELGASPRLGCQFHWFNRNYQVFDDFLTKFNSRKRKALKKERRRVTEQGIELITKSGLAVSAAEWDDFYHFYHLTYLKRSGRQGYLNRQFFQQLADTMAEQLVLVLAYRDGQLIAGALNLRDGDNLYGRYWGCAEEYECLHFEACYYRGIDYAIAQGLSRFDPGAQGEHKIQRGFEPVLTHSNHHILDPEFKRAIDDFLEREAIGIQQYQQDCSSYLPFKKSSD